MHGPGQTLQPRLGFEPKAGNQYLKGHQGAYVGKPGAVKVEPPHVGGRLRRIGQPYKPRARVDEAANEPSAGQAVHPRPGACGPALVLKLGSVKAREAMGGQGGGLPA